MNGAAVNVLRQIFWGTDVHISVGLFLGVDLLGHRVHVCSASVASAEWCPKVVACLYSECLSTSSYGDSSSTPKPVFGTVCFFCLGRPVTERADDLEGIT